MKRRGFKRDDMHRLRRAQNEIFAESRHLQGPLEVAATKYAGDPVVGKVIAFIQEGGSRSLVQPPRVGMPEADQASA